MTDSERQQVLKMIEDGKISAEQGLILMQALDAAPEDEADLLDPPSEDETLQLLPGSGDPADSSAHQAAAAADMPKTDPDFERKLSRFRNLWVIPLWMGVVVTVLSAYGMFTALKSGGLGFWFYFTWLPFIAGVALTAVGFSSRTSRWIYINIKQKPGESPQRIVLTFPLSIISWMLGFAKFSVPDRELGAFNEVMGALMESTHTSEPLLVDVREGDGEHVQIYIG